MHIAFIGLGQMGKAMAPRLLEAGHALTVFNRTRSAADDVAQRGARVAASPNDLVDADVAITMVADDIATRGIWLDSGLAARWPAGSLHLNMSTVGLEVAKALAHIHAQSGSQYVSAPVFGRPALAAKGELDVIAAGTKAALERCEPLFKILAKQVFIVGEQPELANAVKIARNYLLANMVQGLGEAIALTRKAGVQPQDFVNILGNTSFGCPAYLNYGRMIAERAYSQPSFTLSLGLKDVELARTTGQALGVPMANATLIAGQTRKAIAAGFGELDWAALADYIAKEAGL
jgi:3-hydroxyisobutyrate dehydrogenase-like beta-hydroxyacid dehydrogenase